MLQFKVLELVDGIEPPSGTYKDPARPTQLHQQIISILFIVKVFRILLFFQPIFFCFFGTFSRTSPSQFLRQIPEVSNVNVTFNCIENFFTTRTNSFRWIRHLTTCPTNSTKIILKNVSTCKVFCGASPRSRFQNITETKLLVGFSSHNETSNTIA